ncbi:hypothetical protein E5720_17625 [Rhodococcus sp. PAMC28707]|uniref:DUF6545 domain-containing protein n=1 Tax=unclassified Rhodococcus (in: high G+C Gram-positive bacteria) TaxID=192944 RepID=UPI00109D8FDB|nr:MULTISPECIES: DUF6545 domain-containing protein [unclassified Rhodococcus (in: high G+C Gram-positive bacteria)]QCB51796.1 hypothetical protein E5769_17900 [Rhodococcus sp. PAMC28705]QCB60036.1 hypothetical protein E5720_17625 [Rhodococcus sp. PAMC28707]
MTSSVSALIAYPILVFAALVIAGRAVLAGNARSSRRVTTAVTFLLLSGLLRERAVQEQIALRMSGTIDVPLVRQISTVMLMLAMVPLVVMGARWVVGNRSESWNRRILFLAALSAVALLVVGTRSRATGQYIDVTPGWETIVYFGLFSAWTAAMASLYLSVAIRELRHGGLPRRYVVMIVALALLSLWGVEESVSIAISGMAAGLGLAQTFVQWRVAANENNLIFILLLGAGYTAVPLVHRLMELAGLDKWSRAYNGLLPMWADLTSACPEVLLRQSGLNSNPRQRTHRRSVEIRDALSVLGRFNCYQSAGSDIESRLASAIAESAEMRRSGALPGQFRSFPIRSATHLADEISVLESLATHWPLEPAKP